MDRARLAMLVADEFAWGDGDLAIRPHDRLEGLMAVAGVDMERYRREARGSKRERLRWCIVNSADSVQVRIVQTVLDELPWDEDESEHRSQARRQLEAWLDRQRGVALPSSPVEEVQQVLDEFEALVAAHGPSRAFDRLHSAFSAYLRKIHRHYLGEPGTKPLHKLLDAVANNLPGEVDPDGTSARLLRAIKTVSGDLDRLRNAPAHGRLEAGEAGLQSFRIAKGAYASPRGSEVRCGAWLGRPEQGS